MGAAAAALISFAVMIAGSAAPIGHAGRWITDATGNVNAGMLDALAVPSPELVAGTPEGYGYDPSAHVFTLRYSTERADGTAPFPVGSATSVSVPPARYADGYTVRAVGARVVKAGGVLTLASCPGASSVSVTLRPGRGPRGFPGGAGSSASACSSPARR